MIYTIRLPLPGEVDQYRWRSRERAEQYVERVFTPTRERYVELVEVTGDGQRVIDTWIVRRREWVRPEALVQTFSAFLRAQPPDIRANWKTFADALARGKYQQCIGYLQLTPYHYYCALGVAVRVFVPEEEQEELLSHDGLPTLDCVPLGLTIDIAETIVKMNDVYQMSFSSIASIIWNALARSGGESIREEEEA